MTVVSANWREAAEMVAASSSGRHIAKIKLSTAAVVAWAATASRLGVVISRRNLAMANHLTQRNGGALSSSVWRGISPKPHHASA